jgi:large subunit ribosomal protein L22
MEARAVSKYVRVSSLKVLRVSSAVKGKPVEVALNILEVYASESGQEIGEDHPPAVANADQKPSRCRSADVVATSSPTTVRC